MIPRGIIQRLRPNSGEFPTVQYLAQNPALFAEDAWVWSDDGADAFVSTATSWRTRSRAR
jgi:hypothetical protein